VGDSFFFMQMEGKTDGQTEREQANRHFWSLRRHLKIIV